jgi:hypothetical protein
VIIWTNCGVKDREAERIFNHKQNEPSLNTKISRNSLVLSVSTPRSTLFSRAGQASFLFISPLELGAEARKAPMVALHRPGGTSP